MNQPPLDYAVAKEERDRAQARSERYAAALDEVEAKAYRIAIWAVVSIIVNLIQFLALLWVLR